ncbi:MAG TPA: efflux transporter outer membrane subunit [Caulobacteraceae bacterium]|nr:efflux transporter outer membrane subunit [Caulobacteraceae bacterium]
MRGRPAILALAALTLAGCMVGPNYRRPAVATPSGYKEATGWAPAYPSDAADRRDWWTVFNDPTLNYLEARVETSNQTLAGAEAAWRQARALVAEQRAQLFPTVNLTGSATWSGGGSGGGGSGAPGGTSSAYRVGAGATWAPDLWGAIRRNIESARANASASAADVANARLAAQIELASDYIALRQLDEDKRILDATMVDYGQSLTITRNRYNVGVAALSDVLSAQAQLSQTQAEDTDLVQQRAKLEHAIAVLAGESPAALNLSPAPWNLEPPQIPASLPSQLLERRPDIASAERHAAAQSALIGVQVAAFFPNLTLSASGDFASSSLANLFSASSAFWSLGANVAETLFDAGARSARVREARAAYEQAVANYRQTVLSAFAQVEDNLAAQRVLISEQDYSRTALDAALRNERITRNQYLAGVADYTAVVVAETTALADRRAELALEAARLTTAVDLIGALGGGWTVAQGAGNPTAAAAPSGSPAAQ